MPYNPTRLGCYMIVEQVGRNDVLVRYRDANGNRQQTAIKDRLPYLYLRDEDAQFVDEKKEAGYTGVSVSR